MLGTAGILLGALALGTASALVPVVNAEVVAIGAAATSTVPLAVVVAVALAVGQTAGKLVIFSAARRGGTRRRRTRAVAVPAIHQPTAPPRRTTQDRLLSAVGRRWTTAPRRALGLLDSRWRGCGVVLLSASVGLPPLALVSVGCGLARTRRSDFAAFCLAGRSIRFLSLTVPLAAWSG